MARNRNHVKAQALIALEDTSLASHGHRVDERWIWMREHEAHVWDGKTFSVTREPAKKGKPSSEFDRAWDEVAKAHRGTSRVYRPVVLDCVWNNIAAASAAYDRQRTQG